MEAIRARMKKIREQKKIRQDDLADQLGIGRSTYRAIENRRGYVCSVKFDTWLKMVEFFGVIPLPVIVKDVPAYVLGYCSHDSPGSILGSARKDLWKQGVVPHDVPRDEWERMCSQWEKEQTP